MISHKRYLLILSLLYFVLWIALAINPVDRTTWLLENAIPVLFFVLMFATYRRLLFSRLSYTLIFLFLCLHTIGSHYTYSAVPYDTWITSLTGSSLNVTMGAVIAMAVTAGMNGYLQRDFAREWANSFKVKRTHPLGEDEIVRLWRSKP